MVQNAQEHLNLNTLHLNNDEYFQVIPSFLPIGRDKAKHKGKCKAVDSDELKVTGD